MILIKRPLKFYHKLLVLHNCCMDLKQFTFKDVLKDVIPHITIPYFIAHSTDMNAITSPSLNMSKFASLERLKIRLAKASETIFTFLAITAGSAFCLKIDNKTI